MALFRNHIAHRMFSIVLTLHILNLSVDAVDMFPYSVREDVSFNEIESIAEFVLEDILHIQNALPEHDEEDETAELMNTSVEFNVVPHQMLFIDITPQSSLFHFPPATTIVVQPALDILSPPPKA